MTIRTPFQAVRDCAVRLDGAMHDYDALLKQVGDRSLVLLGEATHGTSEFYRMRTEITRRLVEEKGFEVVAAEADWPDAHRLNCFVLGEGDNDPLTAFGDFQRFPEWMWRNQEVLEFITWLGQYNSGCPNSEQVAFYGLDLYSLYRSADAVVGYLDEVDPEQAKIAREIYTCLDHVRDPQQYGYEASRGLRPQCREALLNQLIELQQASIQNTTQEVAKSRGRRFFAEQNARIVLNAEAYYRAMFTSRTESWNQRDKHMADTLVALRRHQRAMGGNGKIVVWTHNSHTGDARATEMGWSGELNLGQQVRTRMARDEALLVGFTTYTGHVAAARDWNETVERCWLRPAVNDSIEKLFHSSRLDRFYLPLHTAEAQALHEILLQRAVGVIYRPETERLSHYFRASLASQFDAVFHLDETTAVRPLDIPAHWSPAEMPETYPFGI